jgi:phosphoribosylglycinamide formyltransferase, formyltetrahydrofolate-dependent
MLKIVVLVSGGGTNLQAIIDSLECGKIRNTVIDTVISNNINAYALERARLAGINAECISPKNYENRDTFHRALVDKLDEIAPDLIVMAGFLVVLPSELVRKYKGKIINVHPSLIPAFCGIGYYGLKVHEAVIERGVKLTGATVHYVDEGTDTGPIILQKAVEVKTGDTAEVLQKRVMEEAEWELLPRAINMIADEKSQKH